MANRNTVDPSVQKDVDQVWASDPSIRYEFVSKDAYASFCMGQERGLIRTISSQRRAYETAGGSNDAQSRLIFNAAVDKHIEQHAARIWQDTPAVRAQFGDYTAFRRAASA